MILQQSGEEAVLNGQITGEIELDFISQNATVQPGDLVMTSGLGGNYPANILVGQVLTVKNETSTLFQTASVQPAVDFSQLDIVLIITNFQPVDISPLHPFTGYPRIKPA